MRGMSALFHSYITLGMGRFRAGWQRISTIAIAVWSLIPGMSLLEVIRVVLFVKRISRMLLFLVGKSTICSKLHTFIMSINVSLIGFGY